MMATWMLVNEIKELAGRQNITLGAAQMDRTCRNCAINFHQDKDLHFKKVVMVVVVIN
jgi:hypothetical protein